MGGVMTLALGWLAADFGLMAVAWHRSDPQLFAKRPDGTRGLASTMVLLPYLVFSGAVWHGARARSHGDGDGGAAVGAGRVRRGA